MLVVDVADDADQQAVASVQARVADYRHRGWKLVGEPFVRRLRPPVPQALVLEALLAGTGRGHQAAKYYRKYGHTTVPDTKSGTLRGWRPNVAGSGKEVRMKQGERIDRSNPGPNERSPVNPVTISKIEKLLNGAGIGCTGTKEKRKERRNEG